jgi:hypothetical protein
VPRRHDRPGLAPRLGWHWRCYVTSAREVSLGEEALMIEKLKSGGYRLYSRKKDPKTGKRRNLGTFKSREAAEKHEREVQYFKHH